MEVKVKQEYETLDKNNFEQVNDFVDRIIEDIWLSSEDDEMLCAMIKDYMFDLINPDLLDFDYGTYDERLSIVNNLKNYVSNENNFRINNPNALDDGY